MSDFEYPMMFTRDNSKDAMYPNRTQYTNVPYTNKLSSLWTEFSLNSYHSWNYPSASASFLPLGHGELANKANFHFSFKAQPSFRFI